MGYRVSLLIAAALSILPGLVLIFFPEMVNQQLLQIHEVGLPANQEGYQRGQEFLTRLVGGQVTGFGVLCLFARNIAEEGTQTAMLKGLTIATLIAVLVSLSQSEGWVNLVFSGPVLLVLVSTLVRRRLSANA